MTRNLRVLCAVSLAAISLLPLSVLAQSSKQPPPSAPVPQRILAAKKIFIANAGEDERSTTGPLYDGGPTRAYDSFYAALKSWDTMNWRAIPPTLTWCWSWSLTSNGRC